MPSSYCSHSPSVPSTTPRHPQRQPHDPPPSPSHDSASSVQFRPRLLIMSSDQSHPTPPKPLNPPGVILHRIGQACLACRRKKVWHGVSYRDLSLELTIEQVKCDGSTPCHNCSSRNFTCEYPTSNDNASASRQCVSPPSLTLESI